MFGYQCLDCDQFWSCQAAPDQGYGAITKWCPLCLPKHVPSIPETRHAISDHRGKVRQ